MLDKTFYIKEAVICTYVCTNNRLSVLTYVQITASFFLNKILFTVEGKIENMFFPAFYMFNERLSTPLMSCCFEINDAD